MPIFCTQFVLFGSTKRDFWVIFAEQIGYNIGIKIFPIPENVGVKCEVSIKSYGCKYLENYKGASEQIKIIWVLNIGIENCGDSQINIMIIMIIKVKLMTKIIIIKCEANTKNCEFKYLKNYKCR